MGVPEGPESDGRISGCVQWINPLFCHIEKQDGKSNKCSFLMNSMVNGESNCQQNATIGGSLEVKWFGEV